MLSRMKNPGRHRDGGVGWKQGESYMGLSGGLEGHTKVLGDRFEYCR